MIWAVAECCVVILKSFALIEDGSEEMEKLEGQWYEQQLGQLFLRLVLQMGAGFSWFLFCGPLATRKTHQKNDFGMVLEGFGCI